MHIFAYMTVSTGSYHNPQFEFCDRIRKVRREVAHLTQKDMAAELGVNLKAYEAWESGRNRPDDIVAVAKRIALRWRGITAGWILGVDDTPPTTPDGEGHPNPRTEDYQFRTLAVA
jgi:DNA-binding XRE family transcriptional regulator